MELLMRGFIILIDEFNYRKSVNSHSISLKKVRNYFFAIPLCQERALADFHSRVVSDSTLRWGLFDFLLSDWFEVQILNTRE